MELEKILLSEAEKFLAENNFKFLTVKTLSDLSKDENYEKTRRFYFAMGFDHLEVFKTLWDESNPCLMMVKNINFKFKDQLKDQSNDQPNTKPNVYEFPECYFDSNLKDCPTDLLAFENFINNLEDKLKNELNPIEKRSLYEHLGVAYRIVHQLDKSELFLLKALSNSFNIKFESNNEIQTASKLIQNLIRLAHTYQWQNEFAKSKVLFDQAKGVINENKVSLIIVAAYHQHFGKYYFDQHYYGLALCEFNLALKIRIEIHAPQDQIDSSQLAVDEALRRWSVNYDRSISIRKARILDAEGIHNAHMLSINEICVKDHSSDEIRVWGGRTFDPSVRIPAIQNQFYLVAEHENKIEGYCQLGFQYNNQKKSAHLFGFYITSNILKRKIGHAMMKLVMEYCHSQNIKLITLSSTITSCEFYKKYGFVVTGEMTGPVINGVMIRGFPMELKLD